MSRLRIFSVLLLTICARGGCHLPDITALIELYNQTLGAQWASNTHWQDSPTPCSMRARWFGVGFFDPCDRWRDGYECNIGRVSSIYLQRNGLRGLLSRWQAVGELKNLSYLDLSWNSLSGSLPTELGSISNLVFVDGSHNEISGSLPTQLGTLNVGNPGVCIQELALSHNALSGFIPSDIAFLEGLERLDLQANRLSGSLPTALCSLPELNALHLGENQLSGTVPTCLGSLGKLRYLDAARNKLSGALPSSLGSVYVATSIHLSYNHFSGELPSQLGKLRVLRSLKLNDNSFVGSIPSEVGSLGSLEVLDLFNNTLVGAIPSSIENLENLKLLYVDNENTEPLQQHYCRQRLPNLRKYSWRILRDRYRQIADSVCDESYDTSFTFSTLEEVTGFET
uniref:Leucine-rich repeat-containing N-terminal plant-type domain-containing protein n=1 Tax=Coccolithus braarudii TaxID=221442 RepID=A0A7S0LP44_9EUKA|mmetsp:Transcript_51146/g.109290  ORF Transcript_51146/g.109290 Transcript_51146/m.109290 type:complete len:397 (+) Transcript_51146:44-1234(+)